MKKIALISVADKTGLTQLGLSLQARGWTLIASGGTARALSQAGVKVQEVSSFTGSPEILDGRVKTLHPYIHGGILARRDRPEHLEQLEDLGCSPIDMVVVNLYPFEESWKEDRAPEDMVENIDIGGVALLRAAAKNWGSVLVVSDPGQYPEVLERLETGQADEPFRRRLAARAFRQTSYYDSLISWYLMEATHLPDAPLTLPLGSRASLKYGENPHQGAALYRHPWGGGDQLAFSAHLSGPELSFNNYQDAQAAWELVLDLPEPACAAVKHATPCGAALAESTAQAFRQARDADPLSIFGGIVAFNQTVDEEAAREMGEILLDVVLAPGFTPEALALLGEKKRLKVLEVSHQGTKTWPGGRWSLSGIGGGLLLQDPDPGYLPPAEWKTVTRREPTAEELEDLKFALAVVKHVRSNAIVLARNLVTTGIGGGQVNRVEACRLAVRSAGQRAQGSVLASDAFFPFADTLEVAAEAGVTALIQPGGSVRDADSIEAADRHGLAMIFTGRRHFKH